MPDKPGHTPIEDHLEDMLTELACECFSSMHDPENAGREVPLIRQHMKYAIARRDHLLRSRACPNRERGYFGRLPQGDSPVPTSIP